MDKTKKNQNITGERKRRNDSFNLWQRFSYCKKLLLYLKPFQNISIPIKNASSQNPAPRKVLLLHGRAHRGKILLSWSHYSVDSLCSGALFGSNSTAGRKYQGSSLPKSLFLSQPNSNTKRSWGDHIIECNPPPAPQPPHPTQTFKTLPGNPGPTLLNAR